MFRSHLSLLITQPSISSALLLAPLLAEGHAASSVQVAVANIQESSHDDDGRDYEINEDKCIEKCWSFWILDIVD